MIIVHAAQEVTPMATNNVVPENPADMELELRIEGMQFT
jgi:hypothetical protein